MVDARPTGDPRAEWAACAPLLAGIARVRLGRRRAEGVEYRDRDERPLTATLPSAPAAVRVYGHDGACAALCFDLDASKGGAQAVARDAAGLERWLAECGARVVTDISPSGGRHVYVPLAERLDYTTARELVEALATHFPTLDPGPHRSLTTGCIRVPGSAHARGGHQALTMSLNAAYDVLRRRNGADVVQAMRVRLTREIAAWRAAAQAPVLSPTAADHATADLGVAAGRRGRGELSARLVRIAREGVYDTARYATASEARQAVIAGAARAGWRLTDVAARLADGRWPGLAALYARYAPHQRHGALARDWRAADRLISGTANEPATDRRNDHVHRSNTSAQESQGGASTAFDEHAYIRTWRAAVRTYEQHRLPGRAGYTLRFVLRALGEMAHRTGSRYLAVGTRSLAVACGVDHSTVSVALHALTAAGWCDRLEAGRGEHADLYALTLPHDLQDTAGTLRWDAGKIHALRPAFRELGHVTALVFEAVETGRARSITALVTVTGISRRAVHEAVDILSAWALLERTSHGLVARPEALSRVAEQLGALDAVTTQLRRYARQRAAWRAYLARHEPDAEPRDIDDVETWWWPPDDAADPSWTLVGAVTPQAAA